MCDDVCVLSQPPAPTTTVEATLPGLGAYKTHVSMKVTNMQLVSYTADKMWSGSSCLTEEASALQNQQERGGTLGQCTVGEVTRTKYKTDLKTHLFKTGLLPLSNCSVWHSFYHVIYKLLLFLTNLLFLYFISVLLFYYVIIIMFFTFTILLLCNCLDILEIISYILITWYIYIYVYIYMCVYIYQHVHTSQ